MRTRKATPAIVVSNTAKSRQLEQMLDNLTTSYKLYWLLGIFDEALEGNRVVTIEHNAARMVSYAWHPIVVHGLSFGATDKLNDVVAIVQKTCSLQADSSPECVLDAILNSKDPELRKKVNGLTTFAPYRLLRPFYSDQLTQERLRRGMMRSISFDGFVNDLIIEFNKRDSNGAPYVFVNGASAMRIDPEWAYFFRKNRLVITNWFDIKLVNYLQPRNLGVTDLRSKLHSPAQRMSPLGISKPSSQPLSMDRESPFVEIPPEPTSAIAQAEELDAHDETDAIAREDTPFQGARRTSVIGANTSADSDRKAHEESNVGAEAHALNNIDISQLRLRASSLDTLQKFGIYTVGELVLYRREELVELRGVNQRTLSLIEERVSGRLRREFVIPGLRREGVSPRPISHNELGVLGLGIVKLKVSETTLRLLRNSMFYVCRTVACTSRDELLDCTGIDLETTFEIEAALGLLLGKRFILGCEKGDLPLVVDGELPNTWRLPQEVQEEEPQNGTTETSSASITTEQAGQTSVTQEGPARPDKNNVSQALKRRLAAGVDRLAKIRREYSVAYFTRALAPSLIEDLKASCGPNLVGGLYVALKEAYRSDPDVEFVDPDIIRFGVVDREKQLRSLYDEDPSLCYREFIEAYRRRYGFDESRIACWLAEYGIDIALEGTEQSIPSESEYLTFLKSELLSECCDRRLVAERFKARFPHGPSDPFDEQTLSLLGYRARGKKLLCKEGLDIERYFDELISSHAHFSRGDEGFEDVIFNDPLFRQVLRCKMRSYEIVEYEKNSFIDTLHLCEQMDVELDDIFSYSEDIAYELRSRQGLPVPFTVWSLRNKYNIHHPLDVLATEGGMSDYFFETLLDIDPKIQCCTLSKKRAFLETDGSFSAGNFIECLIEMNGPMEIDDILDLLKDAYGIEYPLASLRTTMGRTSLYYDDITDSVYNSRSEWEEMVNRELTQGWS